VPNQNYFSFRHSTCTILLLILWFFEQGIENLMISHCRLWLIVVLFSLPLT